MKNMFYKDYFYGFSFEYELNFVILPDKKIQF